MLLVKKCHFFLYLDFVEIRLQIIINYFKEKKTFFDLTKMNFLNSSKTHFLTFGQKMPFFFLYIDLIKIRLEIILSDFAEKKEKIFWP